MKFKSYKYRIYPTLEQIELINKHIGASRWAYNYALNKKIIAYQTEGKSLSRFDIQEELPSLKKAEATAWLNDVNSQTLQASLEDLDKAYTRFFKKHSNFPRFKTKRSDKQSFSVPQNGRVDFSASRLRLPKFKSTIKIILHRKFDGKIKNITISKTPTEKYFASILVDSCAKIPIKCPIDENKAVGIDLGVKTFGVLSDGFIIENPRNLKNSLKSLRRSHRALSRKKPGSNNYNKARIRTALVYEKITNKRLDFLHKTSKMVIEKYDTICLETLSVKNMMKNNFIAQAMSDVSMNKFNILLEYKAEWYGKNILRIGRFEPSSRLCNCGVINKKLKLSDRKWTCGNCGTTHDRDALASSNIKKIAFQSQKQNTAGTVEIYACGLSNSH